MYKFFRILGVSLGDKYIIVIWGRMRGDFVNVLGVGGVGRGYG